MLESPVLIEFFVDGRKIDLRAVYKIIRGFLPVTYSVTTAARRLLADPMTGRPTAPSVDPTIAAPAKLWVSSWASTCHHEVLQTREPSSLQDTECRKRSQGKMQTYYQTSLADTKASYELFRRALSERNESAWAAVTELYHGMVKKWILNHSKFADSGEEADYFVNRAFERLWRYVACKPGKFAQFDELASILQYLKLCAHASVMDDAPALSVPTVSFAPDDGYAYTEDPADMTGGDESYREIEQSELWQTIESYLLDETERIVLFGFFVEGLKNRELLNLYPDRFEDAKQISNKRTAILRRLSRNEEFTEILQEFFYADRVRSGRLFC